MLDFVEVFVHGIPVCMVQKNLVDSSHHLMMINSQVYNEVAYVYFSFMFIVFVLLKKKDNFHFGFVKFVDSHENLLKLFLDFENFFFVKINDFGYLDEKVNLFVVNLHSCNCVLQKCF